MINEWEEFCAYTGTVSYTASKKSDTTWLGRFTFATILEFEGMARILTILARGYLFHSKDGAVILGDPHNRIDYARRALCAWCSVPEDGKHVPDKEWQFQTDFSELYQYHLLCCSCQEKYGLFPWRGFPACVSPAVHARFRYFCCHRQNR